MNETDWRKVNAEIKERSEAIKHRAFESHVLTLVRELAPLQEEASRRISGYPDNKTFKGARLEGEYPHTLLRVRMHEASRDRESEDGYPIWSSHYYTKSPDGVPQPTDVAGEILLLARGG